MLNTNAEYLINAGMDQVVTLAETAFDSTERLTALNLSTARSLTHASFSNMSALLGARDVQTVMSLKTALAQLTLEKSVFHLHHVYEIASHTGDAISNVLESKPAGA